MLSAEDNEILTRVGPGTPMGEPAAPVLDPGLPVVGDRRAGRPARPGSGCSARTWSRSATPTGRVGLIEEHCPHRGASLFYGRNEECGLRCTYHGWKFDVTGQCIDQRSELHPFAQRIRITSYPVHESGGIVWTYMGPAETDDAVPRLRHRVAAGDAGRRRTRSSIYCNWVQSMDGDLDTAHISNLHQFDAIDDVPDDGTDKPGYPSGYMSMKFWRHDPRVADRGGRHLARLPLRGHQDHAQRVPARAGHRLHLPVDPRSSRRSRSPPGRSSWSRSTTSPPTGTTSPPSRPPNPRGLGGPLFFTYEKYPFEMLPPERRRRRARTPGRTTTRSTGSRRRARPTAGSPTSGRRTRWPPRPRARSTTGPASTWAPPTWR